MATSCLRLVFIQKFFLYQLMDFKWVLLLNFQIVNVYLRLFGCHDLLWYFRLRKHVLSAFNVQLDSKDSFTLLVLNLLYRCMQRLVFQFLFVCYKRRASTSFSISLPRLITIEFSPTIAPSRRTLLIPSHRSFLPFFLTRQFLHLSNLLNL